ncbi:hypothetical protein [Stieleria mannarensis]|uniref:hypothetical protein n=1 Tax=Stieleria mannarensis TaxID=2755585 RepID=UPI0016035244|nr:hypothetical protein [Rhodopirellula sp. JC639]
MTTQKKRLLLAAALGAAVAMPVTALRADNPLGTDSEFGDYTSYYEDDAWYDVSEWFDGNDYNPTDEAIGRWDDEKFDFADNATSTDQDNDWNQYSNYGYREGNDSDWFYDYYDDGYGTWDKHSYSIYDDVDDDGLYDSVATYRDTDGDGMYEDYDYFAFDAASEDKHNGKAHAQAKDQGRDKQKQMVSTPTTARGTVEKSKTVTVRDRTHLVVKVNQPGKGPIMVDLGPNRDEVQLSAGDKLYASGHGTNVGETPLLIATDATTDNGSITIDRNGKKYQGKIEKTKTVKFRGEDHQLAKINTDDDKTLMVDLGPKDKLDAKVTDGASVTVQGVPVKVKDRVVLMARQITHNGEKTTIAR